MKEPLVKNAASPTQVKRAENKILSGEEREIEDLRFVLSSPEGRRLYWRFMNKFGFLRISMTGNSTTFFNEGERNCALFLWQEMNAHAPEAFAKMLQELKQY